MSWTGKMIGGTIGFAMLGPLGAVAGAVFGHHAFDKGEENRLTGGEAQKYLSSEEQDQMTFFVACFSMLAKLSAADGSISRDEIRTIEQFMDRDLGLTPRNKQIATQIFNEAASADAGFGEFAGQFHERFHGRPELIDLMLDILLRVSLADGKMSREEEELIRSAVHTFNYSETAFQQLKRKYGPDTSHHYSVLKCSPDDPDEHVKKQYRKLVAEFHPDKIASKGLPEEFTKFATEKFREIQEAWETIRAEREI
ncbi:MAG: TerB family tellurite resistance protein [Thermodesulfobacteriota bacterium]|nr:TerB family tellurite resistance protein [Thermodesulfobacteriota bacterium]